MDRANLRDLRALAPRRAGAREGAAAARVRPGERRRRATSTCPTPTTAAAAASRRCFDLVAGGLRAGCSSEIRAGARAVTLPPGAARRAARRRRRHQRGLPGRRSPTGARRSSRRAPDAAPGRVRGRGRGPALAGRAGRAAHAARARASTSDYLALEWIEPGALERRRRRGARARARGDARRRRATRASARRRARRRELRGFGSLRLPNEPDAPTGRASTPSGACCPLARHRARARRARRGRRAARSSASASASRELCGPARAAGAPARRPVERQRDGRRRRARRG